MEFHDRLITLRRERGLSQEMLGEAIGVSRQTVSKWETGQSWPDFQRLVLLGDFFDLPLDALVRDLDLEPVRSHTAAACRGAEAADGLRRVEGLVNGLLNGLALFGLLGAGFFLLLGVMLGG